MRGLKLPEPLNVKSDQIGCYKIQKLKNCRDGHVAKVLILPGEAVENYYNSLIDAEQKCEEFMSQLLES